MRRYRSLQYIVPTYLSNSARNEAIDDQQPPDRSGKSGLITPVTALQGANVGSRRGCVPTKGSIGPLIAGSTLSSSVEYIDGYFCRTLPISPIHGELKKMKLPSDSASPVQRAMSNRRSDLPLPKRRASNGNINRSKMRRSTKLVERLYCIGNATRYW